MDHKPTEAQRRLLLSLADVSRKVYGDTGLRGGALRRTLQACQRRGWVDAQGLITDSGKAVAGGAQ